MVFQMEVGVSYNFCILTGYLTLQMKVILFVIVGFHDVVEDYIILVSFFTFKNSVIKIYFHIPPSPHYTGRSATSFEWYSAAFLV